MPFLDHARLKPFFYSWDPDNHPDEAAYCWTDGPVSGPEYSDPYWMKHSLKLRALID